MQENTNIVAPGACTVYIVFTSVMPKYFCISGKTGVEYFRYLDGKTPRIKFNIPVPDTYTANVPVSVVKVTDIIVPDLPTLPPAERDRMQGEPEIIYDPTWTVSPASNFTEENVIIHGPAWKALIPPIRLFIDLHEIGHFFYRTEEYCDLYAYVNFMRMGYNRSTAFYSLSNVLRRNEQSMNRLKSIFSTIEKTTGEFSPE